MCPECGRPTIQRFGGEWCRWCRGFIETLRIHRGEGASSTVRVIQATL